MTGLATGTPIARAATAYSNGSRTNGVHSNGVGERLSVGITSERSTLRVVADAPGAASILVVEDDLAVSRLVEFVLTKVGGHRVKHATDAPTGARIFEQDHFDLVILDLNLPAGSGFEFLHRIRRELNSDVPIAVLSGMRQEASRDRCLQLGATEYLTKPFSPGELVRNVERLLQARIVRV